LDLVSQLLGRICPNEVVTRQTTHTHTYSKIENTKEVIRSRKPQNDRQYNDQKEKKKTKGSNADKKTAIYHRKLKIEATRTLLKPR